MRISLFILIVSSILHNCTLCMKNKIQEYRAKQVVTSEMLAERIHPKKDGTQKYLITFFNHQPKCNPQAHDKARHRYLIAKDSSYKQLVEESKEASQKHQQTT